MDSMYKNINKLAPDRNIFTYYKNLEKIEKQRKRWLKQHPNTNIGEKTSAHASNIITIKKPKYKRPQLPEPRKLKEYRKHTFPAAVVDLPPPWQVGKKIIELRGKKDAHEEEEKVEYDFSKFAANYKTPVTAVLYVHFLEVHAVSIRAPSIISALPICFYAITTVTDVKKTSKIVLGNSLRKAKLDLSLHFSIDICPKRLDPSNNIRIEMWCFQDPEFQFVLGSAEIHIFEIIKDAHIIRKLEMWVDGTMSGYVIVEFAFAYGSIGYGHSNQIRNSTLDVHATVSNSMFPRVRLNPPNDIPHGNKFKTRVPNQLKLMDVESIVQEMVDVPPQYINGTLLPGGYKEQTIPMLLEKVEFLEGIPIHCCINTHIYQKTLQATFNDTYGDYLALRHRKDRLNFLEDLINGPQNDIPEFEIGGHLFQELNEQNILNIFENDEESVRHGGSYVYPTDFKCKEGSITELDLEDENFQDTFPCYPRSQGYLSYLFGFSKPPEDITTTNHVGELPQLQKNDSMPVLRSLLKTCCGILIVWGILRAKIYYYSVKLYIGFKDLMNFFFPRFQRRIVPQISVTTASAQGSVTRVHSYFVNEEKEHFMSQTQKLVKKTAALLALEKLEERDQKNNPGGEIPEGMEDKADEDDVVPLIEFDMTESCARWKSKTDVHKSVRSFQ